MVNNIGTRTQFHTNFEISDFKKENEESKAAIENILGKLVDLSSGNDSNSFFNPVYTSAIFFLICCLIPGNFVPFTPTNTNVSTNNHLNFTPLIDKCTPPICNDNSDSRRILIPSNM